MPYTVELSSGARRDFAALEASVAPRVVQWLNILRENPRPHGSLKLKGQIDLYRVRAGNHRIVYQIDDSAFIIRVTAIKHRREAYR